MKILFSKNIKFILALSLLFFALSWGAVFAALYDSAPPKDSDFDGLSDQGEIKIFKTDPFNPDTDGDGFLDGAEAVVGSDPLDPDDPVVKTARANVVANINTTSPITPWPWYVSRAAALVAYCLISLLVVSGIGIKTRLSYKIIQPLTAFILHRHLGIMVSVAALVHVLALLFDNYLKFTILDLLVPFHSSFKPLFVTLGVISFYMLAAVVVTSLFMRLQFPHLWRMLHYLPYPIFVTGLIHGLFTGTDSGSPLVLNIYWFTGVTVGIMTLYRIYYAWNMHRIKMQKRVLIINQNISNAQNPQ
jgi:DMSO/TMAO reductase YedYZ heme-binding membrane subunit